MTDHDYYPWGNSLDDYFPREIVQFKQHTFFPHFYGLDLSCFNVHAPTCPRDTIICLPDDKMASAEAGRFASLSMEDFEFNLVDQFFKLVRIVVKTCLLLIFFLFNITIKNFYLCLFNSHIFSDFLDCLWYNKTLIYWL